MHGVLSVADGVLCRFLFSSLFFFLPYTASESLCETVPFLQTFSPTVKPDLLPSRLFLIYHTTVAYLPPRSFHGGFSLSLVCTAL